MKKFGLLSLALVVALGGLGVGYAAWTDEITISGPINTGSLCVEFLDYFLVNDPCDPATPDWTCDPGFLNRRRVPELKNVGCTEITLVEPDLVQITYHNTYPSYLSTVSVHVENCGTIPLKLYESRLTYPDPYNPGDFITVPLPDGQIVYIPGFDQYGGISNVIEVKWVNGTGVQLEPGEEHEDSFHLHVLQPAMQGSSYTFTISTAAIQWNEYP